MKYTVARPSIIIDLAFPMGDVLTDLASVDGKLMVHVAIINAGMVLCKKC